MADVKINPVFEGFSKKIGDLVFFQVDGKTFVKRKGNPGNPKSMKQMNVRNSLSELVSDWASLPGIMHQGWKELGKKKKMKGNNLFVSENFRKQITGQPIQLFSPVGNMKLAAFTASQGGPGEIICSCSVDGAVDGIHVSLFSKKRSDGMAAGEIVSYNGGADPSLPYTITGLEPGVEYYIYAVVTDGEYSTATVVSASLGVIAAAGV